MGLCSLVHFRDALDPSVALCAVREFHVERDRAQRGNPLHRGRLVQEVEMERCVGHGDVRHAQQPSAVHDARDVALLFPRPEAKDERAAVLRILHVADVLAQDGAIAMLKRVIPFVKQHPLTSLINRHLFVNLFFRKMIFPK